MFFNLKIIKYQIVLIYSSSQQFTIYNELHANITAVDGVTTADEIIMGGKEKMLKALN